MRNRDVRSKEIAVLKRVIVLVEEESGLVKFVDWARGGPELSKSNGNASRPPPKVRLAREHVQIQRIDMISG